MKRVLLSKILFFLIAMTSCLVSCSEDDESDYHAICPMDTIFKTGEDGVPYVEQDIQTKAELARIVNEEVVGHGWKWCNTYEIFENGVASTNPFYDAEPYNQYAPPSPSHYYFKSNTEIVGYFSDLVHSAKVFFNHKVRIEGNKVISMANHYGVPVPDYDFFIDIFDTYVSNGRRYINVVEFIEERVGLTENYVFWKRKVYGVSTYVQMTGKELNEIQKNYNKDYVEFYEDYY